MPFVTRPGGYDLSNQPPYSIEGCSMRMYLLRADYGALQGSVNRYLTDIVSDEGESFHPLGNRVIACFTAASKVTSSDPALGYMHEVDCGFFIPVLRCGADGLPNGWGVFAPYLFVNNDWASVTGREVHGFRKEVATSFSSTHDVNDMSWCHQAAYLDRIETWAIDKPGVDSRLQKHVICEVDGEVQGQAGIAPLDVICSLFGDHPLPHLAESLASMIAGRIHLDWQVHIPIYFLRQLRNPGEGADASPQSIVEGRLGIPISSVHGFHLAGDFTLRFKELASHPFREDLGLAPDEPHNSHLTLNVKLNYELA